MNTTLKGSLIIITIFSLCACVEKEEPVKTVDYYKEHGEERTKKVKECRNNPGEKDETINCINAQQAENIQANKRTGTLPSLNLDKYK